MTNRNGVRGAKAERDLVVWLRSNGFPDACRARGEGAADRGDIGGIPGVCVQAKSAASQRYVMARLRAGQQGALQQAMGRLPVCVVKLPGVGDPGKWWASTPTWYSELGVVAATKLWSAPVPDRCGYTQLSTQVGSSGWVVRGDWLVTTVSDLFGELQ